MASSFRFLVVVILGLLFLAGASCANHVGHTQQREPLLTLDPQNTNDMGAVAGPSYTTPGAYGAYDPRTGDRTSPYPPYFRPDQGR